MTSAHLPPILPTADAQPDADLLRLALPVSQKVVLVVDVVESVRLMASNEADAVTRWLALAQAGQHAITANHGRVVKSLGDGLMAEFDHPRDAVHAALQLHSLAQAGNAGRPPDQHMLLRAGAHATHVYVADNDIFGSGVNLAARIATLAGPGETVVTAEIHDGLTDGLDAELEDLG
jgi:adenylate cyclase